MNAIRLVPLILVKKSLLITSLLLIYLVTGYLALIAIGYVRALLEVNNAIVGGQDGIIVTSYALSPLTSVIREDDVYGLISRFNISVRVEFHMVTVVFSYGEPLIIEGVDYVPEDCIYLDPQASGNLGVSIGDYIPLYSLFTKKTIFLRYCNVSSKSNSLVNYNIAVELRGVNPGYYSFAIIQPERREDMETLYKLMGLDASRYKWLSRVLLILTRGGNEIQLRLVEDPSRWYFERLGIQSDFLIYLGQAVALITLVSTPIIGIGLVVHTTSFTRSLRLLGLSKKSIVYSLLLVNAIPLLISLVLLYTVSVYRVFPEYNLLVYVIKPLVEHFDICIVTIVEALLSSIGIVYGVIKYVE